MRRFALYCLLFVCAVAWAGETNVRPGVNAPYGDADFHRWQAVFEAPAREVYAARDEVLEALQLRPGMAVADIGAGTGFYTLLFAQAVGATGKVYAVDITEDFIVGTLARAHGMRLDNVVGIVNDPKDTRLPAASIDLAFICDTYHHFEYPQTTMTSVRQALRPNGRLALIDFRREEGVSSAWVLNHVRADKDRVIKEIEGVGFALERDLPLLDENYFLVFRKTAETAPAAGGVGQ